MVVEIIRRPLAQEATMRVTYGGVPPEPKERTPTRIHLYMTSQGYVKVRNLDTGDENFVCQFEGDFEAGGKVYLRRVPLGPAFADCFNLGTTANKINVT